MGRLSGWSAVVLLSSSVFVHCAGGTKVGSSCANDEQCGDGVDCIDGTCRRLCNSDAECSTNVEQCEQGVCLPIVGANCMDASDCQTPPPCATATGAGCEMGFCAYPPVAAGASCDDEDVCTNSDRCDGLGACVGEPCGGDTPVCSPAEGGCVECQVDLDCEDPDPVCVSGGCRPCLTCLCRTGEHDGGDGNCVAEETCSSGFVLTFEDVDMDGLGATDSGTCLAPPIPGNLTTTGGDCNDMDNSLGLALVGYADVDVDGFTSSPQEICDTVLPPGLTDVANPPPFVSFRADGASVSGSGLPWSQITGARTEPLNAAYVFGDGTSEDLLLTDFGFDIPLGHTITGVRVNANRLAEETATQDNTVRLVLAGAPAGNNLALPNTWPEPRHDVYYGGPDELWGLSLTPAQVNASTFGVAFSVQQTNTDSRGSIDWVWLEVFTAEASDCNDDLATVWSPAKLSVDEDQDLFGKEGLPETDGCVGDVPPVGVSQNATPGDCDDTDPAAFPGQTQFFDGPRTGGGFDYNCDGAEEQEPLTDHLTCTVGFLTCPAATSSPVAAPMPCGQDQTLDRCISTGAFECEIQQRTITTVCR